MGPDRAEGHGEEYTQGQAVAATETDWAAANKAYRKEAMSWLEKASPSHLIIARMVLTPMMGLLIREVSLASAAWKTKQLHKLAEMFKSGNLAQDALGVEQWPLLSAAFGESERKCLREIADLHNPALYEAISDTDKNISTKHLVFRLLSREAAAVYQRIEVRHMQIPYELFKLAADPGLSAEVTQSCEPSRDSYSSNFLSSFAGRLGSPEARGELVMVVLFTRLNTVRVERTNATIRRRLVVSSRTRCQTSVW